MFPSSVNPFPTSPVPALTLGQYMDGLIAANPHLRDFHERSHFEPSPSNSPEPAQESESTTPERAIMSAFSEPASESPKGKQQASDSDQDSAHCSSEPTTNRKRQVHPSSSDGVPKRARQETEPEAVVVV